jgi:hypothetical protein
MSQRTKGHYPHYKEDRLPSTSDSDHITLRMMLPVLIGNYIIVPIPPYAL